MKEYLVQWEIELKAESAEDAARQALAIMRDPDSMATVFDVFDEDGESERIDLLELDEEEAE